MAIVEESYCDQPGRENGSIDEIPFLEMCLSEKPTFQQKRDGVLRGGRDLRTSNKKNG